MNELTIANKQLSSDWYKLLVDDCKAIITEGVFTSSWILIETYHNLGKRILQDYDNFQREKIYGEKIVTQLAKSLRKSTRTIYRSLQFVKLYPKLTLLPEGKNTNWHQICNKYLSNGEKKERFTICPKCGFEF